jgi:hypothetical protein
MVNEDSPHELSRDGKEVDAIIPSHRAVPHQSQIGLVHECGTLECVIGSLPEQTVSGETAKLFVDQRDELLPRGAFP